MAPVPQSVKIIMGFNTVTALLGVGVLLASFAARNRVNSQGWGGLVSNNVSAVGIAAGLLTLLLSILGCIAAAARNNRLLACYLIGFLIIVCIQIGAAVSMTNYSNALQIRDEGKPSSQLTFGPDIAINNAAFSVFLKCCSGCPPPNTVLSSPNTGLYIGCNNPDPTSFNNYTLTNCLQPGTNTRICSVLKPCDVSSEAKCFVYYPGDPVIIPPISVANTVCTALSVLYIGNSSYIVGPAWQGSCGGGDPVVFLKQMDTFVSDSLIGIASFFTFVAVIEAITLPAGFYLLCCVKKHKLVVIQEEDDNI